MRGRSDELKRVADRLLATRGVTHGGIEIIAVGHPGQGGHARGHTHAKHPRLRKSG
jgi:hypothetical protein